MPIVTNTGIYCGRLNRIATDLAECCRITKGQVEAGHIEGVLEDDGSWTHDGPCWPRKSKVRMEPGADPTQFLETLRKQAKMIDTLQKELLKANEQLARAQAETEERKKKKD